MCRERCYDASENDYLGSKTNLYLPEVPDEKLTHHEISDICAIVYQYDHRCERPGISNYSI